MAVLPNYVFTARWISYRNKAQWARRVSQEKIEIIAIYVNFRRILDWEIKVRD